MRSSLLLRCVGSSSVLALLALVSGCGGNPPKPAVSAQTPTPVVPAPPPVDVSEVPEPMGMVAFVRLGNPEKTVRTAASWARLPMPSARELLASLDEDPTFGAVDLDQPVYGAVSVGLSRSGFDVLAAASLGVRSLDDARAKLAVQHPLVALDNGRWLVKGLTKRSSAKRTEDTADEEGEARDDDRFACILGPAATSPTSTANARITCGERDAVERLEPWLVRTAPRGGAGDADVHLELRTGTVREPLRGFRGVLSQIAGSVVGGLSPAAREMIDALGAEAIDYVTDIERATIDVRAGDDGLTATSRFDFASQTSVMARWATAHPERADAPPPAFWRLPSDVDTASFGRGSDPATWDHPRQLVANLIVDTATKEGLPAADARALSAAFADRTMPLLTGPAVYGKGFDEEALKKAVDLKTYVPSSPKNDPKVEAAIGSHVLGYHLLEIEEPITKVGPMLREWNQVIARPGFVKWMTTVSTTKKPIRARLSGTAGLPKDAVHLEVTIPLPDREQLGDAAKGAPKGKPKKVARPPVVAHVFAVPDAGATWLAFGLDEKLLAKKAAAVLTSAKRGDDVGSAPAFARLRDTKANAVTVVRLRAFQPFLLAAGHGAGGLPSTPDKGEIPILVTSRAEAPGERAPAGSVVSTLRVERGTIEDILRLVLSAR